MRNSQIPVGSFTFWLVWKVFTTFVLVLVSLAAFTRTDLEQKSRFFYLFIVSVIMVISNEELVYGRASEAGIHFRRYFKTHFLPWEAISSITWTASDRLQIQLKRGALFRKTLAAQSFGNSSLSEWLSTPPEVVRWLLVTKPAGADGIELIGPGL
jgi:hypothetical protein